MRMLCLVLVLVCAADGLTSRPLNRLQDNKNEALQVSDAISLVEAGADVEAHVMLGDKTGLFEFTDPEFCPHAKDTDVGMQLSNNQVEYAQNQRSITCPRATHHCCSANRLAGKGASFECALKAVDCRDPVATRKRTEMMDVCSNELDCPMSKTAPTQRQKCCYYKLGMTPGLCYDSCPGTFIDWSPVIARCDNDQDCAVHAQKPGATPGYQYCCEEQSGQRGFCRTKCKGDRKFFTEFKSSKFCPVNKDGKEYSVVEIEAAQNTDTAICDPATHKCCAQSRYASGVAATFKCVPKGDQCSASKYSGRVFGAHLQVCTSEADCSGVLDNDGTPAETCCYYKLGMTPGLCYSACPGTRVDWTTVVARCDSDEDCKTNDALPKTKTRGHIFCCAERQGQRGFCRATCQAKYRAFYEFPSPAFCPNTGDTEDTQLTNVQVAAAVNLKAETCASPKKCCALTRYGAGVGANFVCIPGNKECHDSAYATRVLGKRLRVCSSTVQCAGAKDPSGNKAEKCCYYKLGMTPGLCYPSCSSGGDWTEVISRCTTSQDCIRYSDANRVEARTCCQERSGQPGFCRAYCEKSTTTMFEFRSPAFCPATDEAGTMLTGDQLETKQAANTPTCDPATKQCCSSSRYGAGIADFKCVPTANKAQCSDDRYMLTRPERRMLKVCDNELDCKGVLSEPLNEHWTEEEKEKYTAKKCCYYKLGMTPGLCYSSCPGTSVDWSEVVARCDTSQDCATHAAKPGASPDNLVCCYERPNHRGFCRRYCTDPRQAAFGCGPNSDCALPYGTSYTTVMTGEQKCCQNLRTFETVNRKCSATCADDEVEVTGKPFQYLIGGLTFDKPRSLSAADKWSWSMLRFGEIVNRLVSEPEGFERFLKMLKKKMVLENCKTMGDSALIALRHILTVSLIPMSTFILGEVVGRMPSGADIVDSESADLKNHKTSWEALVTKLTAAKAQDPNFDTAKLDKILLLLQEPLIATPNTAPTIEKGWWKRFNTLFGQAAEQVVERCANYALIVWKKRPNKAAGFKYTDAKMLEHKFTLFLGAMEVLEHFPRNKYPAGADEIEMFAFDGLRKCATLWHRVFYGMHYYEKALEAKAKSTALKYKLLTTGLSAIGTAVASISFGAGPVVMKGLAGLINHVASSEAEDKKQVGEIFFESIRDKQKEHQKEEVTHCEVKNIDHAKFCAHPPSHPLIGEELRAECEKVKDKGWAQQRNCLQVVLRMAEKATDDAAHPFRWRFKANRDTILSAAVIQGNKQQEKQKFAAGRIKLVCGDLDIASNLIVSTGLPEVKAALVQEIKTINDAVERYIKSAEAKPLLKELKKLREKSAKFPAFWEQLPVSNPPRCEWDSMVREHFESFKGLVKLTSSMLTCDEDTFGEDEGREYLKASLGYEEGFERLMVEWERLFPEGAENMEMLVECIAGFIEIAADAAKDMIGVTLPVQEAYIQKHTIYGPANMAEKQDAAKLDTLWEKYNEASSG